MEANGTAAWLSELPPKRDALSIVVPVSVLYVAIFVTGVAGNVVTVVVISRCRCMHTPTNYYLMSLAVSDLLLLLSGLPQEVYSIWIRYPYPFGEAFCVLRGLAAETSANASVLTITAFTVERYLAICKPFQTATRSQAPSRRHRVFKVIAGVWASALLCAGVQAMQFGLMFTDVLRQIPVCTQVRVLLEHSFEVATLVFFAAPMTLMCALYALMARRLHRQRKEAVGHSAPSLRHVAAKKRVIKMLAAVVTAFFLCWAPFHAQRLVAINAGTEIDPSLFDGLTYVSGVLHYVSATVNPILYQLMSRKFRQAGKDTLAGLLPGLAWSVRRRASRHHPHGPRCGKGGGGQCRGHALHRHRRRHPAAGAAAGAEYGHLGHLGLGFRVLASAAPPVSDSTSSSSSDAEGDGDTFPGTSSTVDSDGRAPGRLAAAICPDLVLGTRDLSRSLAPLPEA